MIAFSARFVRHCFDPEPERMRVWCNLHGDHVERQSAVESFWLETAGLPAACLTKSTVNVYSRASRGMRASALPWGTCRLSVHSTAIVQQLYGAVQEYSGAERPEWLDCGPRVLVGSPQ